VNEIKNISSKELQELIDKKEDIQIIDVRIIADTELPFETSVFIPSPERTKRGYIKSSILIPVSLTNARR